MTIRSFKDLIVWQRAIDLAEGVYLTTRSWPAHALYGLTAQTRRAPVAVFANIAEGQGRTGPREFLHHLSIADGSLSEVEALLLFAHRLRLVDDPTLERLSGQVEETRNILRGLIRTLRYPSATPDFRLPTPDSGLKEYRCKP